MWISIYYFTIEIVKVKMSKESGVSEKKFTQADIFKWVSIAIVCVYGIFKTVVYTYKWNKREEYLENLTLFAVLVCTLKLL